MPIAADKIEAICFDLGNTLIEFGPKQMAIQFTVLEKALREMFGACDLARLKAIRDRQIVAPFSNGYKENDMKAITEELIRGIYDVVPEDGQVERLMQTRYECFVQVVEIEDGVLQLLSKLRGRYRLALLSNYPCSRAIHSGLEKTGLSEMFEATVISGDVGYVKPHAKPFEVMLSQLDLPATACVYIGDNWLADVQGAKRMGMQSVLTTQYMPYETFEPAEGDHEPDARISQLDDLKKLLLSSLED
jgi:HAD superfamily hydrolase (TIGR01549 family)